MPSTAELLDEIARREQVFQRAKEIGDKYATKFAGTRTKYQPPLANYTMESGWLPDPHEPEPYTDPLKTTMRNLGMSWRRPKGRTYGMWFTPWKPPSQSKAQTIDLNMREKIAACAALGLSYWSDSTPVGGRTAVWAVKEGRLLFFQVEIDRKNRTAYWREGRAPYEVPGDTDATLDLLAADQPLPEPLFLAEKPKEISRLIIQSAVAHIRHDGSYVTDTETAVLQTIVDKAKYFTGARDIVPLITAELERRVAA